MPALTGFVIAGLVPNSFTLEFHDDQTERLLVSVLVPRSFNYQYYFSEDHFVKHAGDVLVLAGDELDASLQIILRFGDRNPMRVW